MVELVHQFSSCKHCGQRWPGLRYDCPYCGWPRQHTDVTPPPTEGLELPGTPVGAVPQAAAPAPKTGEPIFYDPHTGDPIMPIPQPPKMEPREPTWEELQAARRAPVTKHQLAAQHIAAPALVVASDGPTLPPPIQGAVIDTAPVTIATSQPHHVAALTSEVASPVAELPLDAFEAPKPRKRKEKSS